MSQWSAKAHRQMAPPKLVVRMIRNFWNLLVNASRPGHGRRRHARPPAGATEQATYARCAQAGRHTASDTTHTKQQTGSPDHGIILPWLFQQLHQRPALVIDGDLWDSTGETGHMGRMWVRHVT